MIFEKKPRITHLKPDRSAGVHANQCGATLPPTCQVWEYPC